MMKIGLYLMKVIHNREYFVFIIAFWSASESRNCLKVILAQMVTKSGFIQSKSLFQTIFLNNSFSKETNGLFSSVIYFELILGLVNCVEILNTCSR